ncbi:MAG: TonB-dependent receptor [Gemmatimonadaceae bacterium]
MSRAALVLALLFCAATAVAQSPLERRISLHVRDVALRDALDRLALVAGIRLSYSGDNLPLDRRVSVARDASAVSEVLAELLRAYPVQAVAISSDHIVLAPRGPSAGDTISHPIAVLDRVVVTGSVIAAPERPLPIALDVILGRDIERRDATALSRVLSGSVPGVWLWEQTPSSMVARYGSIRGSSSFGLSFPKVYIDGIEVANPLLLTQITPEVVERVEVIRGPQGAALYGSDAISGVVNIVSRHEGADVAGNRALLRSSVGYAASNFSNHAVAVQEHSLTLRAGSNLRSGGITVGGSSAGEYIPGAYSRELKGMGDARLIGSRSTFTTNGRLYAKNAGVAMSPLLAGLRPDRARADSAPQELRMYSFGSTYTIAPTDQWTYTMTAGVDGYQLVNVADEWSPIPSVADTALRDASGAAVRGTARGSAIRKVGAPDRAEGTITLSAEQSVLWDRTSGEMPLPSSSGPRLEPRDLIGNTGFTIQTNVAIREALYLTAGVRQERVGQTIGDYQFVTLPMLGWALVNDEAHATWKLRAAYGKGVRAARSSMHAASRETKRTVLNPDLEPEEQSGTEIGADVLVGRRFGLHVTRFDQLASGLIQTVTVLDPAGGNSGPGKPSSWFQLQNVGEISNSGWETQAALALGSWSFDGAATFVDSRVESVARRYTGDLRPGDRMLAVPARTLSATASWARRRGGFNVTSTISRASDWINYDRLAIANAYIANGGTSTLTGANLRQFWTTYPGATRLRGSASLDIRRGLVLTVTGENLLNYQRGEPDTITIVPGRTIMLGVRARF